MKLLLCIVVVVVALIILALLYYIFPIANVKGCSMFPTLQEGDKLFTTRLFNHKELKDGEVYIYRHEDKYVIKRLQYHFYIRSTVFCFFLGDNPTESYDSRHYGYINAENIVTKVLWQPKH